MTQQIISYLYRKNKYIKTLDFIDFKNFMNYIKDKLSNTSFTKDRSLPKRNTETVEIICTEIYESFTLCLNNKRQFIPFIDDYIRYI